MIKLHLLLKTLMLIKQLKSNFQIIEIFQQISMECKRKEVKEFKKKN